MGPQEEVPELVLDKWKWAVKRAHWVRAGWCDVAWKRRSEQMQLGSVVASLADVVVLTSTGLELSRRLPKQHLRPKPYPIETTLPFAKSS